jgi:hypothetical protein
MLHEWSAWAVRSPAWELVYGFSCTPPALNAKTPSAKRRAREARHVTLEKCVDKPSAGWCRRYCLTCHSSSMPFQCPAMSNVPSGERARSLIQLDWPGTASNGSWSNSVRSSTCQSDTPWAVPTAISSLSGENASRVFVLMAEEQVRAYSSSGVISGSGVGIGSSSGWHR